MSPIHDTTRPGRVPSPLTVAALSAILNLFGGPFFYKTDIPPSPSTIVIIEPGDRCTQPFPQLPFKFT